MSRAILNCLMNAPEGGKVSIQVVASKESGGYPSVFVSVDEGSALSWKWKYDEFSKLIDGEGDDKDYSRLNQMWTEQVGKVIAPKFKDAYLRMSQLSNTATDTQAGSETVPVPETATPAPQSTDLPVAEEPNDDLPF